MYLTYGSSIDNEGLKPDPKKIEAIQKMNDVAGVRTIIGHGELSTQIFAKSSQNV